MLQTFIRAFDNKNSPILAGNKPVERVYFNLVRLVCCYRCAKWLRDRHRRRRVGSTDGSVPCQTRRCRYDRRRLERDEIPSPYLSHTGTERCGSGRELTRQRAAMQLGPNVTAGFARLHLSVIPARCHLFL